jgi:hypothetical protein
MEYGGVALLFVSAMESGRTVPPTEPVLCHSVETRRVRLRAVRRPFPSVPDGSMIDPIQSERAMTGKTKTQYQHLEPRPGSNYRTLFLKGRRIRAAVVEEATHGPDPSTPEEFAEDYQVPLFEITARYRIPDQVQ